MAHVILFEHLNFHGAHKHVVGAESNLNAQDDSFFNDNVRSFVVIEDNWAFYRTFHRNLQTNIRQFLGLDCILM